MHQVSQSHSIEALTNSTLSTYFWYSIDEEASQQSSMRSDGLHRLYSLYIKDKKECDITYDAFPQFPGMNDFFFFKVSLLWLMLTCTTD